MNKLLYAFLITAIALPLGGCGSPEPANTSTPLPTDTPSPTPTNTPVPTQTLEPIPTIEPTKEVSPETIAEIDALLTKMSKDQKLLNGVVLVAKDGKILLNKAYGLADREKNIPLEVNSPMPIDISGFYATVILHLVDRGELSLEDKICKYIAGCSDAWQEITVKDLLYHQSRIPDPLEDLSEEEQAKIFESKYWFSQLVARLRDKPLLTIEAPATAIWSWFNYSIMNEIVMAINSDSVASYFLKIVLKPLGTQHLGKDFNASELPLGYTDSGNLTMEPLPDKLPYLSFLVSTTEDLFLVCQEFLTPTILSKASHDALHQEMAITFNPGKTTTLDLMGVKSSPYSNDNQLNGVGSWTSWNYTFGYSGMYLIDPEDNVVIIILSNERDRNFMMITKLVYEKLTGKE